MMRPAIADDSFAILTTQAGASPEVRLGDEIRLRLKLSGGQSDPSKLRMLLDGSPLPSLARAEGEERSIKFSDRDLWSSLLSPNRTTPDSYLSSPITMELC